MRLTALAISAVAAFLIALMFTRHWRRSRDPLFACFAVAFALIGTSSALLLAIRSSNDDKPAAYIFRVLGFVLIIAAIAHKNRAGDRGRARAGRWRRAGLQDDGSRAHGREPDRRHDHACGAPPGHDEAARRLELVVARVAAAAPADQDRTGGRAR
jgi:Family of unknown function (DUF5985)